MLARMFQSDRVIPVAVCGLVPVIFIFAAKDWGMTTKITVPRIRLSEATAEHMNDQLNTKSKMLFTATDSKPAYGLGAIYYGPNMTIAKQFNTEEMVAKYTHPTNHTLVRRFPRIICFGVMKCGTTTLRHYMSNHPEVVSLIEPIESRFFSNETRWAGGPRVYLEQMEYSNPWQMTLEKSPGYFSNKDVPARIYRFDKNVKLLLIVKNPVDRVFSQYLHSRDVSHHMPAEMLLEDAFLLPNGTGINKSSRILELSQYAKYLRNYLKYFPLQSIHIIDGDNMIRDPVSELQRLETSIGLRPHFKQHMFFVNEEKGFYCLKQEYIITNISENCYRRPGNIKPGGKAEGYKNLNSRNVTRIRELLVDYFIKPNQRFYKMTGIDFNWK